jgi:hypothetical protein
MGFRSITIRPIPRVRLRAINMAFIPKKKDDETKAYPPLTDSSFRSASLSPMTIEERRKWEVMFARFHQPHAEVIKEIETKTGTQVTNIIQNITSPKTECYWEKVGDDVWYEQGEVYCKYGLHAIHADLSDPDAAPYLKLTNASDTERDGG